MNRIKQTSVIDIHFIIALAVLLIGFTMLNLLDFLFKLPFITCLAFYMIGKYTQDNEVKEFIR